MIIDRILDFSWRIGAYMSPSVPACERDDLVTGSF
jgi:hypothetical protein